MKNNILHKIVDSLTVKTVLTVFGILGGVALITTYFWPTRVNLQYEIISNTNVFDLNTELSKLEILYDSTNLRQTKGNLRIYTIKIINNGGEKIVIGDYDINDPPGLALNKGRVIEIPEIIATSNQYINKNAQIEQYFANKITFSQVIMEPGEFFIVKLLVLHEKDSVPQILSFGKIAGQREIKIIYSSENDNVNAFFGSAIQGDSSIQLIRIGTYTLIPMLLLIALPVLSLYLQDFKIREEFEQKLQVYKKTLEYNLSITNERIFDKFLQGRIVLLLAMQQLVRNEEFLNRAYITLLDQDKNNEHKFHRILDEMSGVMVSSEDMAVIKHLMDDKIIFWSDNKLMVDKGQRKALDDFITFLESDVSLTTHFKSSLTQKTVYSFKKWD